VALILHGHTKARRSRALETNMLNVGIILGSTRPNRNGEAVAKWVFEQTKSRTDARYEVVDIKDYDLPLLDEPIPPSQGKYSQPHTKRWAEKIASLDAFVFVTPEYNHSTSGALKNAIDFLYREWNNTAAGFVSDGSAGGARAVEALRLIMAEIQIADVRAQVMFSLFTDFKNFSQFEPDSRHDKELDAMLKQVVSWGSALQAVRTEAHTTAA
jgi:NAD(P)H-dependent FMN reductase